MPLDNSITPERITETERLIRPCVADDIYLI
jgi:hypothetical protein